MKVLKQKSRNLLLVVLLLVFSFQSYTQEERWSFYFGKIKSQLDSKSDLFFNRKIDTVFFTIESTDSILGYFVKVGNKVKKVNSYRTEHEGIYLYNMKIPKKRIKKYKQILIYRRNGNVGVNIEKLKIPLYECYDFVDLNLHSKAITYRNTILISE